MSKNRRLHHNAIELGAILKKVPEISREVQSLTFENAPCFQVRSYRALVRVVGFFKYKLKTHLLFRGQTQCFGAMKASLHRRNLPPSDKSVQAFLRRFRKVMEHDRSSVSTLSTEPLLQHYGLNTRWLDVVDSLPHALFFACNDLWTSPASPDKHTFSPTLRNFGFIYVLDIGKMRAVTRAGSPVVGYNKTSSGLHLADLRSLKPSTALRPHAQHGLLVRASASDTDLWPHVVARIAVPTKEARAWIAGEALTRESLFPPQVWDDFYKKVQSVRMKSFLANEVKAGANWGSVLVFDFSA